MSWISRAMSVSRRLAPSKRSSARASSSRAALAASSAARASRSASASAFSASCRRSAQARRSALGACDLGDQRRALLGEDLRRVFELGAVALGLGDALFERGDLGARRRRGARSSRPCRLASAVSRRSASSASRAIACCSARTSASLARLPVISSRTRGELGFEVGGGRQRGQRALGLGLGGGSPRRGWR